MVACGSVLSEEPGCAINKFAYERAKEADLNHRQIDVAILQVDAITRRLLGEATPVLEHATLGGGGTGKTYCAKRVTRPLAQYVYGKAADIGVAFSNAAAKVLGNATTVHNVTAQAANSTFERLEDKNLDDRLCYRIGSLSRAYEARNLQV